MEIETCAEMTARAREENDSGLAGFLDLLDLLRQPARHARSQRVPPSRPIERKPVNRPLGLRHQLGHARNRAEESSIIRGSQSRYSRLPPGLPSASASPGL